MKEIMNVAPSIEIRLCQPGESQAVVDLGDLHKRTLGLLPRRAVERYVIEKNVLGAFCRGKLVGYILFSLPGMKIRITQLCVGEEWVGVGIARRLVDELETRYADRRGITLNCRRNWPANGMWPKLQFQPIATKDGRGKDKDELTVWWRDFGHPDLFTLELTNNPKTITFLDSNVIRDLATERPQSARSWPLMDAGFSSQVTLFRTPALAVELNRTIADKSERDAALTFVSTHTMLSEVDKESVKDISAQLKSSITEFDPRRDSSFDDDLRLIAESISVDGELFITNDEKIQSTLGTAAKKLGLNILLPYQARMYVDDKDDESKYAPRWLLNSQLISREYNPGEQLPLRKYLSTSNGEKLSTFKHYIHDSIIISNKNNGEQKLIEIEEEQIAFYCSYSADGVALQVPLLRVSRTNLENILSRQLLFAFQNDALQRGYKVIRVTDPGIGPSEHIRNWLEIDGWNPINGHWQKRVSRSIVGPSSPISADETAKFEHNEWPSKLSGGKLINILIPIQNSFASGLLGHDNPLPLSDVRLAASRDKVYFRSKPISMVANQQARIIWYSSGREGGQVVAISQLLRQRHGSPEAIFEQYGDYGVVDLEKLREWAKDDRITALTFRDTEVLDYPIPFRTVQNWIASETGRNPPTFQAPMKVSEQIFFRIYRQGFNIQ